MSTDPHEAKRAIRAVVGGLPAQFWFLWGGILINRVGTFVFPLLALYLTQRRGFSDPQVGFTIALYGLGNAIGSQVGGWLADRIGRRTTMLLGLSSGAVAMVALGLADSRTGVALCTFALGLVGDSHRPAMQAMVADLVPAGDRARAYGLVYWVLNLGFALAAMLAGFLVRFSYFALFLCDALGTLAYAAVVFAFLRETRPQSAAPLRGFGALLVPLRDRVFLAFWCLSVATSSIFMQCMVTLPLAMKHAGLSPAAFGRALAVNGILIVFVQPWASPTLARLSPSTALACGTALMGVGFGLTAFAHSALQYTLTVVVWTLGEIAVVPIAATVVAALAPPAFRGTYQGTYSIAWAISWILGPIVGTQALARFGGRFWVACFIVALLVAWGHMMSADARARRLSA
jgi:predicted MFS family arabinose efflux permease